jgi:hypothetical protein
VEKRPCTASPPDCPRKATRWLPADPSSRVPDLLIILVGGAQLKLISCKYLSDAEWSSWRACTHRIFNGIWKECLDTPSILVKEVVLDKVWVKH